MIRAGYGLGVGTRHQGSLARPYVTDGATVSIPMHYSDFGSSRGSRVPFDAPVTSPRVVQALDLASGVGSSGTRRPLSWPCTQHPPEQLRAIRMGRTP